MSQAKQKIAGSGERVRQMRLQAAMTQDKLAIMSNVSLRTVQRAELGEPLQLETLASLAAALKTTVHDLIDRESDQEKSERSEVVADQNAVVLRETSSGKLIVDLLMNSYSGEIRCEAEPTKENIALLAGMVEVMEQLTQDPWQIPQDRPSLTLAGRLRKAVELSENIVDLSMSDIAVYAGSYTASTQVPRYDYDGGGMYIKIDQPPKPVAVFKIVISKRGLDRIVLRVDDQWNEPEPLKPFQGSDDVPF